MVHPASLLIGLGLDHLLGEPKKHHPLVIFGKWAKQIEHLLYPKKRKARYEIVFLGLLAWFVAVIPIITAISLVYFLFPSIHFFLDCVFTYFCIGWKSLKQHARAVYFPLHENNIKCAKHAVSMIVSRDTKHMNDSDIRKAALESTLENGNDAVFGAIFWLLIAGAPGITFYRLCNTLDASWGYRNLRYEYFGKAAARIDDGLNWLPARLTAFSYGLMGHLPGALQCWKHQAKLCSSPNAGPVMCAGAGALQIEIGGDAYYHGKPVKRPAIGLGRRPINDDILRSTSLIDRTVILWSAATILFWILK